MVAGYNQTIPYPLLVSRQGDATATSQKWVGAGPVKLYADSRVFNIAFGFTREPSTLAPAECSVYLSGFTKRTVALHGGAPRRCSRISGSGKISGAQLMKKVDYAAANIQVLKSPEFDQRPVETLHRLAVAYLADRQQAEAQWVLARTVRIDPIRLDVRMMLGRLDVAEWRSLQF